MAKKTVDVIITVHVEEHKKFHNDCHKGHTDFFNLLVNQKKQIPLTLLLCRDKDTETCFNCDRQLIDELNSIGVVEFGLHVHPSLSRFSYSKQKKIITNEYLKLIKSTGITPKSFSGGHWCINSDTIHIINDLGILIDASIVPGCRVHSCIGTVVQHSSKFKLPYWVSPDNIATEDIDSSLLEMPISIDSKNRILDITTTPTWNILNHLESLSQEKKKRHYLHMTFHSYDVLFPDGQPNYIYEKILYIYERLNDYFDEVSPLTCYEFYKNHHKERAQ